MSLPGADPLGIDHPPGAVSHYFTVDVEEYFQVSAFEPYVSRDDWSRFESRVARGVDSILELLAVHQSRGTFFVLGWIAEHHPDVVRRIAAAGHEVASHGWDHLRVTHQDPEHFRLSVRRSKHLLEDLSGQAVVGFRAPSFSIVPGTEWALDVLLDEGYRYDSSLFPVRRKGYGYPAAARTPHWVSRPAGRLFEVPPATLRRFGHNLPAAGGAYFRIFPYRVIQAAFADAELEKTPATFYIHPWELDPGQPRLPVSWVTRMRHYTGLARTRDRLERLLSEFRFTAIADRLVVAEACR